MTVNNINNIEKQIYKYKFSVIIPIYNVEKYLEETILSVIKQTINFKKNIQIILVNDGSPDNSEKICLKYKDKYPENIVYIKQKNAGVSVARNNGKKYAQGKYINFLDSDDTWEKDVFEKVYKFFEKNYNIIDMVACRMKFFGEINGFKHALDYKFEKDSIVNIKEDYTKIQLSSASAFFKNDVIQNYEFDETLKYAEDAKLIAKLLLNKEKYGILKTAVYNYRRRDDNTSAIQTSTTNKAWYNQTIERCYEEVFNYSKQKYERVIPYFQYQVMYDLQWRLAVPFDNTLGETEKDKYINSLKNLLMQIDDTIICEQKKMVGETKIYALSLKYNNDIKKDFVCINKKLFFNNIRIANLYNNYLMIIRNLDIEDETLKIEGQITCILPENDYDIYFEDNNGNKYYLEYYKMNHKKRYGIDRVILEPRGFRINIPLNNIKYIKAILYYKKEDIELKLNFEAYAKLNKTYRYSYYTKNDYMIISQRNIIKIYEYSIIRHLKMEILYIMQLIKHKKIKEILYRILYYIEKLINKKPIWIISDRPDMADDNGYHMFKYLVENEKNAKIYFAISKKSKDYNKIKKIGRTLKFGSFMFKVKFLCASKIISSQANEFVINAFGKRKQWLKDLYKFDFVFLQHGILKNDLSAWLHKQNKNIKLFITSSQKEYESVINGNYAYDSKIVKLTGLPRYDTLFTNELPKKQIIFMPTWRKSIAGIEINDLGDRQYNSEFKNSKYCMFYNKLINDERILNIMKQYGYTGKFFVHPTLKRQYIDFHGNEQIKVYNVAENYQREFKESALLITDYSSVAFDFAYLKKPIIYSQFDIDSFYASQIYDKGYYNDDKDGFGPVCYDYETTVTNIIEYLKNECKLDEKYEERINSFYYKFDTKNCERVYKEILKLDGKCNIEKSKHNCTCI